MDSDMLDQKEAAPLIGVSPFTLNRWRHERFGPPFIRISARCVKYRRGDVETWLERRRVETSDSRRLAAASRSDPSGDPEATR